MTQRIVLQNLWLLWWVGLESNSAAIISKEV